MAIKSDAQRKAVAKYNSSNYDQVQVRLKKGSKEILQTAATKSGVSLNKYILTAIAAAVGVPVSTFERE